MCFLPDTRTVRRPCHCKRATRRAKQRVQQRHKQPAGWGGYGPPARPSVNIGSCWKSTPRITAQVLLATADSDHTAFALGAAVSDPSRRRRVVVAEPGCAWTTRRAGHRSLVRGRRFVATAFHQKRKGSRLRHRNPSRRGHGGGVWNRGSDGSAPGYRRQRPGYRRSTQARLQCTGAQSRRSIPAPVPSA